MVVRCAVDGETDKKTGSGACSLCAEVKMKMKIFIGMEKKNFLLPTLPKKPDLFSIFLTALCFCKSFEHSTV